MTAKLENCTPAIHSELMPVCIGETQRHSASSFRSHCVLSRKTSQTQITCACPILKVEPANKDVRALLARYKKESAAANKKDAAMYKSIFQKLAKLPHKDASNAQSKAAAADTAAAMDADAPSASDAENKPEAANGLDSAQENGHAEAPAAAVPPAAEPMAVEG